MTAYIVTWKIGVDADNPREAAKQALEIQRDVDNFVTVFEVRKAGSDLFETHQVDLADGD